MKIGQMFLVGFRGTTVSKEDWIVRAIREHDLGGILFFDRNIDGSVQNFSNFDELKALVCSLGQFADIPLFFAVDQEGGKVCRLKGQNGFDSTAGAAETAVLGIRQTEQEAEKIALMLKEVGLNLNFAPVVDLNVNPQNPVIGRFGRSYGSDPETVVRHADVFIEQHHKHGIGCCLKHFPGHGSSGKDSHLGFVDISNSWKHSELQPYTRLIAEGYEDGIMTGHLVHHGLDEQGLPATLSREMIHGLLRREMKFNGVVFSDDLQMKAITDGWDYKQAVQRAVLAGVDVLVVGNNLDNWEGAVTEGIEAIEELLRDNIVSERQIAQSLRNISTMKLKIQGEAQWKIGTRHTVW